MEQPKIVNPEPLLEPLLYSGLLPGGAMEAGGGWLSVFGGEPYSATYQHSGATSMNVGDGTYLVLPWPTGFTYGEFRLWCLWEQFSAGNDGELWIDFRSGSDRSRLVIEPPAPMVYKTWQEFVIADLASAVVAVTGAGANMAAVDRLDCSVVAHGGGALRSRIYTDDWTGSVARGGWLLRVRGGA